MNILRTAGTGLALTGVAIVGGGPLMEGVASAHDAKVVAVADCSDGTALDSNPEVTLGFIDFGDQVGNTVHTSATGGFENNHPVIAGEPNFNVSVQTPAGDVLVKAAWPKNLKKFDFVIEKCEVTPPDTTPEDTTPASTAPPETNPVATDAATTTTTAVVEVITPPVPPTTAAKVTSNTLPATGLSRTERFSAYGGAALLLGAAAIGLTRRSRSV